MGAADVDFGKWRVFVGELQRASRRVRGVLACSTRSKSKAGHSVRNDVAESAMANGGSVSSFC